jgi:hypothetical protein
MERLSRDGDLYLFEWTERDRKLPLSRRRIHPGAGQVVKATASDITENMTTTSVTVNISLDFFSIRNYGGKRLDYRPARRRIASAVFLNDCSANHAVRVVEIPARMDSQGNTFSHEVRLFAGKQVIGIHNPRVFSPCGASSTAPRRNTHWNCRLHPAR